MNKFDVHLPLMPGEEKQLEEVASENDGLVYMSLSFTSIPMESAKKIVDHIVTSIIAGDVVNMPFSVFFDSPPKTEDDDKCSESTN